ncbi:MAG: helix-turn-helix domain-containing protein [Gemmatimonadota bacterium]|nr:helix-turn-helix domain-containing protein [Gemmatimonadota bacterium]MDP7030778.1 helix-turn-helix domain-containing protein [Gemmatimonadota bacterium]
MIPKPGRTVVQIDLLDAGETAASLHITRATLYKLVKDGRVPAVKRNGKWAFDPKAIESLFFTPTHDDAPEEHGTDR